MTHAAFARLLPSVKMAAIQRAAEALAFPARAETFVTTATDRTYAVVCLPNHRQGRDEYVTYLVCPPREDGDATFDSGHYGYETLRDATRGMYDRAL